MRKSTASSRSSGSGRAIGENDTVAVPAIERAAKSGVTSIFRCSMSTFRSRANLRPGLLPLGVGKSRCLLHLQSISSIAPLSGREGRETAAAKAIKMDRFTRYGYTHTVPPESKSLQTMSRCGAGPAPTLSQKSPHLASYRQCRAGASPETINRLMPLRRSDAAKLTSSPVS